MLTWLFYFSLLSYLCEKQNPSMPLTKSAQGKLKRFFIVVVFRSINTWP